jgi:tRNA nucleotidyltransferase/poly(A) polymerase
MEHSAIKLFLNILPNSIWANKVFSVGGYERDRILGIDSEDVDIVVEHKGGAEQFAKFIHNTFPDETSNSYEIGKGYPIWNIMFKDDVIINNQVFHTANTKIDIADTQKESFPDENTRQRVTQFGTLAEDAERRDFTVNQLYRNLTTNEILDISGTSVNDIKNGILKGHPNVDMNKIFFDDPLRIIRLLRFHAKYKWHIPMDILRIAKKQASRISIVSSERIVGELKKLGNITEGFYHVFRMMKILGILPYVIPELEALINIPSQEEKKLDERKVHLEGDVFKHTMLTLKHIKPTFALQLAGLLHDIAKPVTIKIIDNKIQHLGHDSIGGNMVEEILRRLKVDLDTIEKVKIIVENHMRIYDLQHASAKPYRKFIREINVNIDDLIELAKADSIATLIEKNNQIVPCEFPQVIIDNIEKYRNEIPVQKYVYVLNGYEIMELLNIKEGIEIGKAQKILKDLEDEIGLPMRDKDFAKQKLKEKYNENR